MSDWLVSNVSRVLYISVNNVIVIKKNKLLLLLKYCWVLDILQPFVSLLLFATFDGILGSERHKYK